MEIIPNVLHGTDQNTNLKTHNNNLVQFFNFTHIF